MELEKSRNTEEKMKKAALHNLGCKVNAYETEAMQEMLEHAGYVFFFACFFIEVKQNFS